MPVLRTATEADVPVVAEIWYAGWRDGHLGNVPDELVEIRTPSSFHSRTAARVGDITVAETSSGIAGFTMVVRDEVEQLYVAVGHRGTGLAAELLTAAERRIASAGYEVAWLAVVPGNGRARRFYERQGWSDDGPFDYPARLEDGGTIPVPCHRYTKPLS